VITDLHPLRAALSSALVALDFDGTLAPLSPHPDDARPLAGAQQILRDVRATGATLAVVTGRSVASLLRVTAFGAVPGIIIYGTHGAERWQAGELRTPAVPPGLDELRLSLPGLLTTAHEPDLWIEDKGLSLVIHARTAHRPARLDGRSRTWPDRRADRRHRAGSAGSHHAPAGDAQWEVTCGSMVRQFWSS